MRLRILVWLSLIALTTTLAVGQKKSPINGRWEVKVGAQTYSFTFAEDEGDVSGTATLPDGTTIEIDYGLIVGPDLEFSTTEKNIEYEWTGEVSRSGIKGDRLNLENDQNVTFTGKKKN